MIVVLADDLSGAAEVAGVAHAHGLSAEVQTAFASTSAEVIAIDTNSRSLSAEDAAQTVRAVMQQVALARPEWIFKKVDSVLRGPVAAEVSAAIDCLGVRQALLVSANPSRKRVVKSGRIYIDGIPLHETAFRDDPEYPARSAAIIERLGLGGTGLSVSMCEPGHELPLSRLIIGNASNEADIDQWARSIDENHLPAGGADFFAAFLRSKCAKVETSGTTRFTAGAPSAGEPASVGTTLILCGSTAGWPRRSDRCRQVGIEIVELLGVRTDSADDGSSVTADLVARAAQRVAIRLSERRIALLTIGRKHHGSSTPQTLVQALVTTAGEAVKLCGGIDCFLIEGGETASAIARAFGWARLQVACAVDPGITALRPAGVDSLTVLVKPGSYPWPEALCWQLAGADGSVTSRV